MRLLRAIAGVIAVVVSGCGSPAEPEGPVTGTWLLRSVAGSPLPARIHAEAPSLLVHSDTLSFAEVWLTVVGMPNMGSFRREGIPGGLPVRTEQGYYARTDGDQVFLTIVCPSNASCVAGDRRGRIEGNVLTLHYTPVQYGRPLRSPLVYERVR